MKFDGDYLDYLLIGAALMTGLIHLYVGITVSFSLLTLAGAGFIGGTVLYVSGVYRDLIVITSIPYTLAQFVMYYRFYGFSLGTVAAIDKAVQLIFVLASAFYLSGRIRELS